MVNLDRATEHLKLSFRVRSRQIDLQFWIASCRSLAEAYITMSSYSVPADVAGYLHQPHVSLTKL